MNIITLALCCSLLLFGLVITAVFAERRVIPDRWITGSGSYALSAAISTGGLAYYGIFIYAANIDNSAFHYYFGASLIFILGTLFLKPIYQVIKRYHLENLNDLLAFRFRQKSIGLILALMSLALLPIISVQIRLVAEMFQHVLYSTTPDSSPSSSIWMISFLLSSAILMFNFIMGSYRINRRMRNNGLIAVVALDTIIRWVCLYTVAGLAIWQVFGGFTGMQDWLSNNSPQASHGIISINNKSILIASFASILCLPHIFHMVFGEVPKKRSLNKSFWLVPVIIMSFSLPIMPIVWATKALMVDNNISHYLIALPLYLENTLVTVLVLLACLSAYFCTTIILTANATTSLINYVVLPILQPSKAKNLSKWMRTSRHTVGALFMLTAWLLSNIITSSELLFALSVVSIGIMTQYLPGVIAAIYFPKASSKGFLAGLITGLLVYVYLILKNISFGCIQCQDWLYSDVIAQSIYINAIQISLLANIIVLATVSVLYKRSDKDLLASNLTSVPDSLNQTQARLTTNSVNDFITALVPLVGINEANQQVQRALVELKFDYEEQRPYALIQLREVLERNLSETIGVSVAQNAINQLIPYTLSQAHTSSRFNEERIDHLQTGFTGIAGELDKLRRFHRQTLARLPVGVCYISAQNEVLLWNESLAGLSGLSSNETEGANLKQLPEPWCSLIGNFLSSADNSINKIAAQINDNQHWLTLHKEKHQIDDRRAHITDNVVVIEDITEVKTLEDELIHTERLASIGRLAAGVAHEIGNPVTGIACLAQNLKLDSDQPEVLETAAEIITQTARISSIMHTLVSFSHAGGAHIDCKQQSVDLSQCIREAIKLIRLDKIATQVNFQLTTYDSPIIFGDEQRLLQVFLNLLNNARDASEADSDILITLYQMNNEAFVNITDQGSGIPTAIQERVFEPFFTTKEPGKGTGLGLALVFGIIEEHEGSIKMVSPVKNNKGTSFIVCLPITDSG